MITYSDGSIFDCGATAIVNAVNCVGVMGAGLAKAFADKFPLMDLDYIEQCKLGLLEPGKVHTYYSNLDPDAPLIINFPTKDDWRNPSQLDYIEFGMEALVDLVRRFRIGSIGIPALGCGLGGLNWDDVRSIIERHASNYVVDWVNWIIFPPQ